MLKLFRYPLFNLGFWFCAFVFLLLNCAPKDAYPLTQLSGHLTNYGFPMLAYRTSIDVGPPHDMGPYSLIYWPGFGSDIVIAVVSSLLAGMITEYLYRRFSKHQ